VDERDEHVGGNAGIHTHTDTIRVFPRWLETPTR
jgi:hypothetical protein